MATSKALKGPLSVLSGATTDDAPDYNAQMKSLVDELRGSPEQDDKDRMLSWSAGLGSGADGSGLGGALGRAAAAESGWRTESKKLKASYLPLIMNAVAAQQANNIQSKLVGSLGQKPIADMSLEDVNNLENQGGQKGLFEKWKAAKAGLEIKQGWNVMPDGKKVYIADPSKGVGVDSNGQVVQLPGASDALAGIAGAQEKAKLDAQTDYAMEDGIDPVTGATIRVAKRRALQQAGAPTSVVGGPTPNGGAGPAPTPAPGGMPAQANVSAINSPALRSLPTPEAGLTGSFTGDPETVFKTIAGLKDPQERANALSAYATQMTSNPTAGSPGTTAPIPGAPDTGGAGFVTGRSPRQKAGDEALVDTNKDWLKGSYAPALEQGAAANQMMDNLNSARLALRTLGNGTGWGTPQMQKAAEILGSLGVEGAEKKAAAYQTFQQAAMTQVNSVLNLAKGPQTDQDARRAQETFIGLGKTPQANQFMIDYAQAVAERNKRRSDYYKAAMPIARADGDLSAVDRSWSKVDRSVWDSPVMRRWNKQLKGE